MTTEFRHGQTGQRTSTATTSAARCCRHRRTATTCNARTALPAITCRTRTMRFIPTLNLLVEGRYARMRRRRERRHRIRPIGTETQRPGLPEYTRD